MWVSCVCIQSTNILCTCICYQSRLTLLSPRQQTRGCHVPHGSLTPAAPRSAARASSRRRLQSLARWLASSALLPFTRFQVSTSSSLTPHPVNCSHSPNRHAAKAAYKRFRGNPGYLQDLGHSTLVVYKAKTLAYLEAMPRRGQQTCPGTSKDTWEPWQLKQPDGPL